MKPGFIRVNLKKMDFSVQLPPKKRIIKDYTLCTRSYPQMYHCPLVIYVVWPRAVDPRAWVQRVLSLIILFFRCDILLYLALFFTFSFIIHLAKKCTIWKQIKLHYSDVSFFQKIVDIFAPTPFSQIWRYFYHLPPKKRVKFVPPPKLFVEK